jgi:hypothetical protein
LSLEKIDMVPASHLHIIIVKGLKKFIVGLLLVLLPPVAKEEAHSRNSQQISGRLITDQRE